MSQMLQMLSVVHEAIGLSGKEVIPLNVCSVLSPNCDGFDLNTVQTKLCLLPEVTCFTVAEKREAVRTFQGFVYLPDYTFDNHPDIDILILGAGDFTIASELKWLQETVPKVEIDSFLTLTQMYREYYSR